MKLATRNKQPLKYALLIGVEPVYALDDEGNRIIDYVLQSKSEMGHENHQHSKWSTVVNY